MAVLLLGAAGCGGGGGKDEAAQVVRGSGYHFEAPKDWHVVRSGTQVQAADGDSTFALVSVSRFPLLHPAGKELTPKVVEELDGVADGVADQQNGRMLSEETIEIAGHQARRYEIAYKSRGQALVERMAFVLQGKTEYLLLCRYEEKGDVGPCDRFIESFTLLP